MDYEDALARLRNQPKAIVLQLFTDMPLNHLPVVIDGLLRQGDLLLVGGKSKRWKSWARMDLLYCMANGFDWLGFKCHKGLVVHFDLELHAADVRHRFDQIHQSYCNEGLRGNFDNMRFATLRGEEFTQETLEGVTELLTPLGPIIFSLDPVYRLLGGKSENDQAAVNQLLNEFLALGEHVRCAIALTQHFSKGNQSEKDPEDRFSGSGVWARFPDCLITITDLEEQNCFAADFILRSFPPVERIALRWEFPRFRIDSSLDPDKLKTHPGGRHKQTNADMLCSIIHQDENIPNSELASRFKKIFGKSQSSFDRCLREAKKNNWIHDSPLGYGLTPNYIEKNGSTHEN